MLTTIENIDLSRALGRNGLLPAPVRTERRRARDLITQFGVEFDVDVPVEKLTPAERTIVAIARALDGWSSADNVLVLDEPTAALQGEEVGKLFEAVRRVVSGGAGVIMISHRLDEVVDLADRVVVLRDGRVVGDHLRGGFDQRSLVRLIAGETGDDSRELPGVAQLGDVILSVRGLRSDHLLGVDIDVHAGEIVGVTGLLGSGMEQIAGTIFGATPARAGLIAIAGHDTTGGSPAAAIAAGAGYVPSDRRRYGAVVTMNAKENLTLPQLTSLRTRAGRIDGRSETREANKWMAEVGVRPTDSADRSFSLFSVIAKWLRNKPRLLLLEEPTQGVDVAAQASIHDLVARVAADGAAVLVSSTDTKELVTLCHRVLVLHDGVVAAELEGSRLTEPALVAATIDRPTTAEEG
jgi:ribose transport system ATP-binding protein